MRVLLFRCLSAITLSMAVAVPMAMASTPEITQFGHDIRVAPDQKTGDLTCIYCSIYVRGQVAGEITAIRGNVVIEENGNVAGDMTAVLGNIRAERGANISGEVTTVGGAVRRHPEATIAGDVTAMQGVAWVYMALLSPFLILAGIIALIVWLVRRRRPAPDFARAA